MTALEFEQLHAARWRELEKWVAADDEKTVDPQRFTGLYRTCCEHLAFAEARGFPQHMVERLAAVTARAHQMIYRGSDFGWQRIVRTLTDSFPAAVRRDRAYVLGAAILLMVPTFALGWATYHHPDLILSVVDTRTADEFEQMYGPAAEALGRTRDAGSNWAMFGFYILNNIGIAFQCFATGIVFGVGSVLFLLFNGVYGGAIAGYVAARGYGTNFFSFVATHSAFELTAIILSGGAGLRIGKSLLLPGRLTRVASLQDAALETSPIIFGAAVMLVIAAAVEAFWSSAAWVTALPKYICAAVCWSLVVLFFLRRPRAR